MGRRTYDSEETRANWEKIQRMSTADQNRFLAQTLEDLTGPLWLDCNCSRGERAGALRKKKKDKESNRHVVFIRMSTINS